MGSSRPASVISAGCFLFGVFVLEATISGTSGPADFLFHFSGLTCRPSHWSRKALLDWAVQRRENRFGSAGCETVSTRSRSIAGRLSPDLGPKMKSNREVDAASVSPANHP